MQCKTRASQPTTTNNSDSEQEERNAKKDQTNKSGKEARG
jgi:hypothetical protein